MLNPRESNDTYNDMTDQDLRDEVIGKVVVAVNPSERSITLNDGTILGFRDSSDCCAWFEAGVGEGKIVDNAITDITSTDHVSDYDSECSPSMSDYTLHLLAKSTKVADVHITGDETSGYYVHSIIMDVYIPDDVG